MFTNHNLSIHMFNVNFDNVKSCKYRFYPVSVRWVGGQQCTEMYTNIDTHVISIIMTYYYNYSDGCY